MSSYVRHEGGATWHAADFSLADRVRGSTPAAHCGERPPSGKRWREVRADPHPGDRLCPSCWSALLGDLGETP